MLRAIRWLLLALLVLPLTAWACAALWIDGPAQRPLAGALAAGFAVATLAIWIALRPLPRALLSSLLLFGAVLAWWLHIPARNDRDWSPEYANAPSARFEGDRVTIQNVRNFGYRTETDYTPRWETRTFDLSHVTGLDLYFSTWGSPHIAHTIASFQFSDAPPLAISIETRRERGETYSALRGFFRQFELYYVIADERDLVRLRTSFRSDETVYLYRLRTPPARARAMLRSYLEDADRLVHEPRWYNALIHNCTTSILIHTEAAGARMGFHWQLFANGHLPELFYQEGVINHAMPFAELKAASDVTARGHAATDAPDYSDRIRVGLPDRPPQVVPGVAP